MRSSSETTGSAMSAEPPVIRPRAAVWPDSLHQNTSDVPSWLVDKYAESALTGTVASR